MSDGAIRIPSGSQTVGPFFSIGLEYLIDRAPTMQAGAEGIIEIRGVVIDADGAPVPDAMLEFWSADSIVAEGDANENSSEVPSGFRRAATDGNGEFRVTMPRPVALPFPSGQNQAPHMLVLVFARGLLRHLLSRVYFAGDLANDRDPVLLSIPEDRRRTLIARPTDGAPGSYCWNVILQGNDETVFFAW